ncbi:unnamed protein product [Ceratitis capitata]|uniref:(Mediterranean fruit fly) hypothetical protein n=1 Tax=Ceratitis capitata TaxID=7213 RepID=A0A811UQF5_CERCA|nr:unnamed protein product [Ceratitis capitata]CAD7001370.1 unnamed protein product [Ceratitis capitata]
MSNNRFQLLFDDDDQVCVQKTSKPPPIYLRDKSIDLIGKNNFRVVPIEKENIQEVKVQTYGEDSYRNVAGNFEKEKKSFYTFQLKSSRSSVVILESIEHSVSPTEIESALKDESFGIKNVFNVPNRKNIPQPMLRAYIESDFQLLKKGEVHPIYKLR